MDEFLMWSGIGVLGGAALLLVTGWQEKRDAKAADERKKKAAATKAHWDEFHAQRRARAAAMVAGSAHGFTSARPAPHRGGESNGARNEH